MNAPNQVEIVIADDHRILLESLSDFLNNISGYSVVGMARTGTEALRMVQLRRPHLLLLDISIPEIDGVEVARRLQSSHTKILVLTMYSDHALMQTCFNYGVQGYVTKDISPTRLCEAISEVVKGNTFISMSANGISVDATPLPPPALNELSMREEEVLRLVARGFTSKEIAEKLSISPSTVDTYRTRISEKLGVKHRSDLVQIALQHGLLGQSAS